MDQHPDPADVEALRQIIQPATTHRADELARLIIAVEIARANIESAHDVGRRASRSVRAKK
jgi:hypothetical protein